MSLTSRPGAVLDGLDAVDRVLHDHVETRAAVLVEVAPELDQVLGAVRQAAAGGKRLRAAFCLWGARAVTGGPLPDGAVEAAAAIELFHLAALVHDDLMDRSDLRRGRPTVHRRFADEHAGRDGRGDGEGHGRAVAVLVGDLCLTWSDDLLAGALDRTPTTAPAARAVWERMRTQVIAGQYLDVLGHTEPAVTTDRVRRVLHYKSAKYTAEHPLLLGATLAGGPPTLLAHHAAFGLAVGEAFQLRDDVLGVFGDPGTTGKPVLDDVREGKRTLLLALAEEEADPGQRALLQRHVGDPDLDERGLHDVRQVLTETGSLDRVESRITALVDRAMHELDAMSVHAEARTALTDLSVACAWRAA